MNNAITEQVLRVRDAQKTEISAEAIITAYHEGGRDELMHRGLKDFGTKHPLFEHISSNAAWYYLMAISFELFESYKYDRGRIMLRIATAAFAMIPFAVLWERRWSTILIC